MDDRLFFSRPVFVNIKIYFPLLNLIPPILPELRILDAVPAPAVFFLRAAVPAGEKLHGVLSSIE